VHDRTTGATTRVSLAPSGIEFDEMTHDPSISGDGRVVAFMFIANMKSTQLFARDRQANQTVLVSATPGGLAGNSHSFEPAVSADGRFVAFSSAASDLVAGDANSGADVFVRDLQAGTTSLVHRDSAGVQGNGQTFSAPAISGDGRFVVFASDSTNLVAGDTNGLVDVFLRDLQTGTTSLIPLGHASGFPLVEVAISSDGLFVAFASTVALDPADTNGTSDIYVRDVQAGTTARVSLDSGGMQVSGNSGKPAISADGRFVAFQSDASALVPGDTNAAVDVFLRDRLTGRTTRASISSAGLQGNAASEYPAISGDGLIVAFDSAATDLVASDTNGVRDVFAIDRTCTGAISSYCVAKTNSLGCVPSIGSLGMPSRSGPDDFFVTASNVRNNKLGIMLWSRTPGNTPFFGGTLCLGQPFKRTPGQSSGGSPSGHDCTGTYSFHFTQAYMQQQNLAADATVHAQYWSRDPGFPVPNNVGLTNGLRFTICP